jgi:hypothetical protein
MILSLLVVLSPYKDPQPLARAEKPAAEIEIALRGRRNESVELDARVPDGWIVTFCSPRVCAPFRVRLTLPASGRQSLQLKLIRRDEHASMPRSITVTASDGARATYRLRGQG